ncbi:MAG: TRAP transporter substrate-binding protein DctP [Alphaproteobacteria bacterium]
MRNVWSGVVCGLVMAAAGGAAATEKIEWNHSVWGGPRAVTRNIEYMAEQVSKASGGNFTIRVHYGDAISPARENLDGIKLGAFESAHFCASYHPGKNPAMNALDLPFLPIEGFDAMEAVFDAYYNHPVVVTEMERWGAIPFMSSILPQYEFMGVGEPPRDMDGWKNKRVRALGGIGEAMRRLGSVPTTVPAPEVYTALERGMVDAASFPFSYSHAAYRLHEISRWYTSNMAPGTLGGCGMVVNKAAFDRLPPEWRQALLDAKPGAYEALKRGSIEADEENLPLFKRIGLIEVRYTQEQLDRFREIGGRPVWDSWVEDATAKGLPGQELLDFILAEAAKAAN